MVSNSYNTTLKKGIVKNVVAVFNQVQETELHFWHMQWGAEVAPLSVSDIIGRELTCQKNMAGLHGW